MRPSCYSFLRRIVTISGFERAWHDFYCVNFYSPYTCAGWISAYIPSISFNQRDRMDEPVTTIPVIRNSRTYLVDVTGRGRILEFKGAGRPPSRENEKLIIAEAKQEAKLIASGHMPSRAVATTPAPRARAVSTPSAPRSSSVSNAFMDDAALLKDLIHLHGMMGKLVDGATRGDTYSAIITGGPGSGKSYTCEKVLEEAAEDPTRRTRYNMLEGVSLTAFQLFQELHKFRHRGEITVLDDSDTLLNDESSMLMLKSALNTKPKRKLRWGSGAETGIPNNEYVYEGGLILLSNQDFNGQIDKVAKNGGMLSKRQQGLEALRSRSDMLDLRMKDRRAQWLWTEYSIKTYDVLRSFGLTKEEQTGVLDWMREHRDRLLECSIRSAVKLVPWVKINRRDPEQDWRRNAETIQFKRED